MYRVRVEKLIVELKWNIKKYVINIKKGRKRRGEELKIDGINRKIMV